MGEPITLEVERYLDHLTVERGLSEHTVVAYRRDLRRYLDFLATRDVVEPDAVEEATVRSFVASLERVDLRRRRAALSGQPRSPERSRRFGPSIDSWSAKASPIGTRRSRSLNPNSHARLPRPLTVEEVTRLLEAPDPASPTGLRDRAILELLYGAGLRISELVGVDVDDVDLEHGSVRVLGKGGKEREVPLGRMGREAIAAYLTRARPEFVSAIAAEGRCS